MTTRVPPKPVLILSRQATAFVDALAAKQQRQIAERLQELLLASDSLPGEQLRGYAPWRRLKSGEFRIIFELDDDHCRIHLIGKRNDDEIYKALKRLWKK